MTILNLGQDFTDQNQPQEFKPNPEELKKLSEEQEKQGAEEVKEAPPEGGELEKETPPEPPAEEKPAPTEVAGDDIEETKKQVEGLLKEREKLLSEIQNLRGQRRELKQEEIAKVEQKIDEFKDIHPEDEALIDKVLKKKGILTQEQASQMFYKSVEKEEVRKFLEKFPEYRPENDKEDINWNALQREFSDYRKPDDPHRISELLEKAHSAISRLPNDRTLGAKKQQIKVASAGSGGTQRSSSQGKTLNPDTRAMLSRGGFTEEDIRKMESRLE